MGSARRTSVDRTGRTETEIEMRCNARQCNATRNEELEMGVGKGDRNRERSGMHSQKADVREALFTLTVAV